MKVTKSYIKQLVEQELKKTLNEEYDANFFKDSAGREYMMSVQADKGHTKIFADNEETGVMEFLAIFNSLSPEDVKEYILANADSLHSNRFKKGYIEYNI
tara:strand:+ start:208 stop:507 length:300 start_codon:yes stop_codon:yes gene_type:complete